MDAPIYYATPRLRETINLQGRKANWLAAQVNWSKFMMCHAMARRRPVPADRGQVMAAILGVPFGVLFELADANGSVSPSEAA